MTRSLGFVLGESGFLSGYADTSEQRPGRTRQIDLGVGTLTSQSGLPNRFKIDSHHLGQNEVSAPSDNVESQGPEIERSSGLG